MTLMIADPIIENEAVLMRRIGYSPHENFEGKLGFVRRAGSLPFPRFHIHLKTRNPVGLFLNIHFDAKRETYEQGRTHSLEKEGEALNVEIVRIYNALKRNYAQISLIRTK